MEEQKTTRIRSAIRNINKIAYTIRNFYRSFANTDFREFKNMEYGTVEMENVTDLQRLRYIKRLDMAKNGYINDELKNLLAFEKEKNRLLDKEIKVVSVGKVEFLEKENVCATIKLGYDQMDRCFKIAYSSYDNIPKWKNFKAGEMIAHLSRLHPKVSHALELRHEFNDTVHLRKEDLKRTISTYNYFVAEAFQANKYVKKNILKPSEAFLSDSLQYIGKQFFLDLKTEQSQVLTLTDVNSDYLVFESFLKRVPKPKTHYFSREEFKNLFIDNQIELLAKLQHDLRLGAKDGILYISHTDNTDTKASRKWIMFDEVLDSDSIPIKAKFYLSKTVIKDKNFCMEKDAIVLQSDSSKAYLKKHFRTSEWHFAEEKTVGQDLNFRPITPQVLSYIRNNYDQSENYEQVKKEFSKPKIRTVPKVQSHGQKV